MVRFLLSLSAHSHKLSISNVVPGVKDEHQRRISPARSYQRLQSISSSMTCIWSIFDHCRSCWCWGNSVKTFRNCQETERSTMKTREFERRRNHTWGTICWSEKRYVFTALANRLCLQEFSFPLVPRSTFQSCGWWCTKGKGKVNRYLEQWRQRTASGILTSLSVEEAKEFQCNLRLTKVSTSVVPKVRKTRVLTFLSSFRWSGVSLLISTLETLWFHSSGWSVFEWFPKFQGSTPLQQFKRESF